MKQALKVTEDRLRNARIRRVTLLSPLLGVAIDAYAYGAQEGWEKRQGMGMDMGMEEDNGRGMDTGSGRGMDVGGSRQGRRNRPMDTGMDAGMGMRSGRRSGRRSRHRQYGYVHAQRQTQPA